MSDMVKTKIMQDHGIPVRLPQLCCNMPSHIIVNLSKVLQRLLRFGNSSTSKGPTETKKLEVPSARSNVSGKSLSHVSSPNIANIPVFFAFIWASQVSCVASVEVVSDSAKLNIISRNEGTDPVVIALTLGIVMVGAVAWAVKGKPAPSTMSLQ